MIDSTCGIHYLTQTAGRDMDRIRDALGGEFSDVTERGGFGQPRSFVHETGVQIYFGSTRADQPICLNAPGEVCETYADWLLDKALQLQSIFTRVDIATDIGPPGDARKRLVQMERCWKRKLVITDMDYRSHDWIKSDREGEGATAYYGGKSSRLQLRAYDKRGPLRLEWQFRPTRQLGGFLPEILRRRGPRPLWRTCAQYAVWPLPWYQELLEGDTIDWPLERTKAGGLQSYLDSLREQHGPNLWALMLLGLTLQDLAVEPERPRGRVITKYTRWADEAPEVGYNPEALKKALRCKHRSKSSRV